MSKRQTTLTTADREARDWMIRVGAAAPLILACALLFAVLVAGDLIGWVAALVAWAFIAVVALVQTDVSERRRPAAAGVAGPLPVAEPHLVDDTGLGLAIIERLPDPIVVLDRGARIVLRNQAAQGLIGPAAVGKHVAVVIRHAPLVAAVRDALENGTASTVDYSVPVPVERHYQAHISLIERPNGQARHSQLPGKAERHVLIRLHDDTDARRLETMRVDFVANASHELKTPLASMTGFIDTLRGHARDDPGAQEKFLGIMADQATRMRRLIDDLLSLSRIEMREHVQPMKTVDLRQVVGEVKRSVGGLTAEKDIEIEIKADPELPAVRGDHDELQQLVQNLVDNAIRYAASGKRIDISLRTDTIGDSRAVVLSVRDYGPGIPREHLPRLTERFYRVDAAESRARGGTGLGLAIVKHIANRHRATLTVDSRIGAGSEFTIRLPLDGTIVTEARQRA